MSEHTDSWLDGKVKEGEEVRKVRGNRKRRRRDRDILRKDWMN